jgi:hypothetical protein
MAMMKSDRNLAEVTIAAPGGKGVRYLATPDLVMILIWFLGSVPARAIALMAFDLVRTWQSYLIKLDHSLAELAARLWLAYNLCRLILLEVRYAA